MTFFFLVIITHIFSSCLILISLAAFQTHYEDMETKFFAIFQQVFHCFKTDMSFFASTVSLFLIYITSFLDLSLLLVSHGITLIFADMQHPKLGTLFPSDILQGVKSSLNAFDELCSSLSILS